MKDLFAARFFLPRRRAFVISHCPIYIRRKKRTVTVFSQPVIVGLFRHLAPRQNHRYRVQWSLLWPVCRINRSFSRLDRRKKWKTAAMCVSEQVSSIRSFYCSVRGYCGNNFFATNWRGIYSLATNTLGWIMPISVRNWTVQWTRSK